MQIAPVILSAAECVCDARAVLGEGPMWDPRNHALYWVDIKAPAIHRYDPAGGKPTTWTIEEMIGFLLPDRNGTNFIAGLASGFAQISLEPGGGTARVRKLYDPEPDRPGNRFNDGKRAPDGSIWAGTMDDAEKDASGSWWRLAPDGSLSCLESGYAVTNGPAFDRDRSRVYLTDSARREVYVADMIGNGKGFENKRIFHRFSEQDGSPDGMTVDHAGAVWIAFWDGGCLRRFAPDGALIQSVALPARRPTSLAFSPTGDALFVTSASIGIKPSTQRLAGGLFRLDVSPA